ncbi:unnamed protein product [Adineta steineri]|uniref:RING-type E3 ubiquitin transferase n=1 Tax=Adineta steineri TaxID=433720 RepID=A0A815BJK6_9BILA|nr:unnamed protein product [Adineta steineri]CAF1272445.1 unnamed protein product [Adineta steineri]
MFLCPNTENLKCPITLELFHDPVIAQDGHTYEREAIVAWLTQNGTSPKTREPMTIESLRPNHTVKQFVDEFQSTSLQKHYRFKLDVDIRKAKRQPIFEAPGKVIFEGQWIVKSGPPVVLLNIEGAKARQEASYYVRLGSHPHVVHTYGIVENDNNRLILAQEYATEGNLGRLLKDGDFQPSQAVLLAIFLQIIDAMTYLAEYDIVHGDLACRNVLVFRFNNSDATQNLVKLTDFGLTRASTLYTVVGSTASTTMAVVPIRYAAPEILQRGDTSKYSEKSDVYSMGVLMFEACSQGQLPYESIEDENEVRRRKINGEILSQPENCDDALWNIIVGCWHQDPEARPTFKKLKELLLELQSRPISTVLRQPSTEIVVQPLQQYAHVIQNTVENYKHSHVQMLSLNKQNFTSNTNLPIDNISSNTNSSTTVVDCQFCKTHLHKLGELIHDPTATTLDLLLENIGDNGVEHLSDVLQENKTLLTLNLSGNTIGEKGARYVAKALRKNQTLTTLILCDNQIGDIGAQHIAEAIESNPTLQKDLHDRIAKLGSHYTNILASALNINQTLVELDLSKNSVGDAGAQSLAKALQKNRTLLTLCLNSNAIDDTGAQHLIEAFKLNKTLLTLNLCDNLISDECSKSLNNSLINIESPRCVHFQ